MDNPQHLATIVASAAFVLALALGWVASHSHFCTMGALSDVVTMGDRGRLRMMLLAIAVAMMATNLMVGLGWIDVSKSLYGADRLLWASHLVGGMLFGVGMTIASGCGARNLVRLGGGNLKSLVVLMCLGLVAYMTLRGVLAPVRVHALEVWSLDLGRSQLLPRILADASGLSSIHATLLCATVIAAGILVYVAKDSEFRRSPQYIAGGVLVGVLVALGWYVTGHIGYLAEDPNTLEEAFVGTNTRRPESFTFVGPIAYGLELALLWTDASLRVTFGIAGVVGVATGALVYAIFKRQFRWEGFTSASDLRQHLLGGALMGFGGVCAMGCTIGQGITGLSTLALGSFITWIGLATGCVMTIKWMMWRLEAQAA